MEEDDRPCRHHTPEDKMVRPPAFSQKRPTGTVVLTYYIRNQQGLKIGELAIVYEGDEVLIGTTHD